MYLDTAEEAVWHVWNAQQFMQVAVMQWIVLQT